MQQLIKTFKTQVIGGFDKADVMDYIEKLAAERNKLSKELAGAVEQRDALKSENAALCESRDALISERDILKADNDRLREDLLSQREQQRSSAELEREELSKKQAEFEEKEREFNKLRDAVKERALNFKTASDSVSEALDSLLDMI